MPGVAGAAALQARPANRSWMSAGATHDDLLYVSDGYAEVYVYSYPSGRLAGELTGFVAPPLGECVDGAGDVFIVTAPSGYQTSVVYEYAHGGSEPIATLSDEAPGEGCSVDPSTGNLAVANPTDSTNPYGKYGSVAVYPHAQGNPNVFYTSTFHFDFCGYDDRGNLYLDAPDPYGDDEALIRLSKGSGTFEEISLDTKFYGSATPASVQWDGKDMTVTSDPARRGPLLVYRLSINGSSGKVTGTTQLSSKKNNYIGQTWVLRRTYVAMNAYKHGKLRASLWIYPTGGEPRRSITLGAGAKWGLIVSRAQGQRGR